MGKKVKSDIPLIIETGHPEKAQKKLSTDSFKLLR